MNKNEVVSDCKLNPNRSVFFSHAKEVRETNSIDELATLLASGKWFAVCASMNMQTGGYSFSLLRVDD